MVERCPKAILGISGELFFNLYFRIMVGERLQYRKTGTCGTSVIVVSLLTSIWRSNSIMLYSWCDLLLLLLARVGCQEGDISCIPHKRSCGGLHQRYERSAWLSTDIKVTYLHRRREWLRPTHRQLQTQATKSGPGLMVYDCVSAEPSVTPAWQLRECESAQCEQVHGILFNFWSNGTMSSVPEKKKEENQQLV